MHNLAVILLQAAKLDEAESWERKSWSAKRQILGPRHEETLTSTDTLAVVLGRKGQFADAHSLLSESFQMAKDVLGAEHPTTRIIHRDLGRNFLWQGKLDDAELTLREIWELTSRVPGSAPDFNLSCADLLGEVLVALERYSDAESLLTDALAQRVRTAPAAWQTASTRSLLGVAIARQRRFTEAEALLTDGYNGMYAVRNQIPPAHLLALRAAGERLVEFFAAHERPEKADEWRGILENRR